MSSRLTYWTGIWEPGREALSNEVDLLRRRLAPAAPVVSFSAGQRSRLLPRYGAIQLSVDRFGVLRALAAILEPLSDFSHVVGALDAWHLLRVLGRRPVVFTAAIAGKPLDASLYDKVDYFAAESRPLADTLVRAGVPGSRIRLVYPGVDLTRFCPMRRPAEPFRVLFASSPSSPADFERRGIPLIVEAARRCPEVEVILLWRKWGNVEACLCALPALDLPRNLRVELRDAADMAAVFQSVHATMFLPAEGHGKSCPNSVVEGLASGCPSILNVHCGIADLVGLRGAGIVVNPATPDAVAGAIREISRGFGTFSRHARALAEDCFSEQIFVRHYEDLYGRLSGEGTGSAGSRAVA